MNKKGFTLVELLVSIVILSLIMVFITSFILGLTDLKDDAQLDINLLVNQAAISKTLNYDVNEYKVSSVGCDSETCTINFKEEALGTRTIEISDKTLKYYDDNNKTYMVRTLEDKEFNKITLSNDLNSVQKIIISFKNSENEIIEGYDIEVYIYPKANVWDGGAGGDEPGGEEENPFG